MKSLIEIRQAIAEQLFKQVKPVPVHVHPGRFDAAELQRLAVKAPAIHLAILGINKAEDSSWGKIAPVQFGVFTLTRDVPGCSRDDAALLLINTLMSYIPANDWQLDECVEGAASVAARNLYGAQTAKTKVAMWAVTWQQKIKMGGAISTQEFEALAKFVELHGEHVLADGNEPSAGTQITLNQ